mgnify:FL=1
MTERKDGPSRRRVLKGAAAGLVTAGVAPTINTSAYAQEYRNKPTGDI